MSWQTCPLCKGTGIQITDGAINSVNTQCRVCKGAGIINELTGLPPTGIITSTTTITSTLDTEDTNLKQ